MESVYGGVEAGCSAAGVFGVKGHNDWISNQAQWTVVHSSNFQIPLYPPEQDLLIRSVGSGGRSEPRNTRGLRCGLLTGPLDTHPRNPSKTPFRLRSS